MWDGDYELPASQIDSVAKRAKLRQRRNPYWYGVSGGRGGVSLGYCRAANGPGTWVGKLVVVGSRIEEKLAEADDAGAGGHALSYARAVTAVMEWARQRYAGLEERAGGKAAMTAPTVKSAVDNYVAERKRKSAHGSNAESRLVKHVLADEVFAATKLSKLTVRAVTSWRDGLAHNLSPATVNRLLNDLRAALNAAAIIHRRELPAHLPSEIAIGTKAIPASSNARRQILSDDEVRLVVEKAFTIAPEGDFGRLVTLAAATGARFSQLAGLVVADVQAGAGRVMVPTSNKGKRAGAQGRIAVPVGPDVLNHLRPILSQRRPDEPLLMRWLKRQTGAFKWEKVERSSWKTASEIDRMWSEAVAAANLPEDTVMYALRHSSIVRGLRLGLPVRLVAALHDTSTAMIEKHYAAFFVDATEDLARRAILGLSPTLAAEPVV